MIAERFGDAQALDLIAAARRFYETHDDAYDYLAFFNASGVQPGSGVLAFETTVRSNRRGIGDTPVDLGLQFGSANRLQSRAQRPLLRRPRLHLQKALQMAIIIRFFCPMSSCVSARCAPKIAARAS